MDTVAIIAGIAVLLVIVELLIPTGGVLALIGAAGLVTAGIVALGDNDEAADYIGPALITLGVLSAGAFFLITPKILRAHRDEPVRAGWEEMIGKVGEVRERLSPTGHIWVNGALWKARVPDGEPDVPIGNSVRIESLDGLTLVVSVAGDAQTATKGS